MREDPPHGIDNDASMAESVDASMRGNALLSAALARKVAAACLEGVEMGLADPLLIVSACDAAMTPARAYFDSFPVLERIKAMHRVQVGMFASHEKVSLEMAGKVVKEASTKLEETGRQVSQRCLDHTRGALLGASFDAQRSAAILFATKSEKLIKSTPSIRSMYVNYFLTLCLLKIPTSPFRTPDVRSTSEHIVMPLLRFS